MNDISIQTCDLLSTADERWIKRRKRDIRAFELLKLILVLTLFLQTVFLLGLAYLPFNGGGFHLNILTLIVIVQFHRRFITELDLITIAHDPTILNQLKLLHPSIVSTPLPKSPDTPKS